MAASLLVLLKSGDTVLAHQRIYGCTYSLLTIWLARFGVRTQFVDMTDLDATERAIRRFDPRVIYFETPVNPTLELIDIAAIRRLHCWKCWILSKIPRSTITISKWIMI